MTTLPTLAPAAAPQSAPGTVLGRRGVCCLGAVLLGLTAAAYFPLWQNDFVNFDDEPYLVKNKPPPPPPRAVEGLAGLDLSWAWTNQTTPYWMPLTWLSLQFDAQFFSTRNSQGEVVLSPVAFHADNLFWHAANTLLLFALGCRLGGAPGRSFLLAALFALHPMHVESVAWAIERKDVLSSFFGLLTLWLYVRWAEKPGRLRYLAVAAAYLASLLAKPMLITLPFVLLLLDFWPLRRWGAAAATGTAAGLALPRVSFGHLVREKLLLFLLAAAIAQLTLNTRDRHGALVSLSTLSLTDRLGNIPIAYDAYLSATFYPVGLAVMYPHPRGDWSPLEALAGVGVLTALTALCWWQRRRRPWLLVGWLWFAGTLVPVIGLAQGGKQAWADRFSYWPHIGLFLAVAWEIGDLVERWHIPSLVAGAAGALVLGSLAALTWVQVGYWRSSVTLWEHALAVTRNNDYVHEHLSQAYLRVGRTDEAKFHLEEATRIQRQRLRGPGK
jgi:protein O-mannosyl-transferase